MINQLFRTKFASNLTPFVVFLALNALLGFMLILINYDSWARPGELPVGIIFSLLLVCLVAGGLSLLRYNREKSSRLYAQLPVTSLQVRIAYWSHASLYLFISSLLLLLILLYARATSLLDTVLFTLLYFFHAGVLAAVVSLITSNNVRLIPEEIRKRTVVYFLLATAIVFLFLIAFGFIVMGYISAYAGAIERWFLVSLVMMLLCAGLVALDIHLFCKKDNYLG